MTQETINGLHSCKPGNEPVVGQVKLFVVQHMTSKNGKPYLKIKSANAENGGTPHRILQAEPTGFTDSYGNISFKEQIGGSRIFSSKPKNKKEHPQKMRHSISRWITVQLVGQSMRILLIKSRFSSDWRHGVKWFHRIVYSVLCTFACNIIADGGKWPLYLK